MKKSWSRALRDKKARSATSYPIGTVAFYGPNDRYASKVSAGIATSEHARVELLERWYDDDGLDVRIDPKVGRAVAAFLRRHKAKRTIVTDGIIGCPHEEGADYAEGQECPECTWWHGRDRWTGELM